MVYKISRSKKRVRRRVQKVIDGDTFCVRNRVWGSKCIRIAGIDTPEYGQRGYASAKRNLNKLRGKVVTIMPVGKSFGRTVAKVPYIKRIMKKRRV